MFYKPFLAADGRLALFWRLLFTLFVQSVIVIVFFTLPNFIFTLSPFYLKDAHDLFLPSTNGDIRIAAILLIFSILGVAAMILFVFWARHKIDHRPRTGIALTKLTGHRLELLGGLFLGGSIAGIAAGIAFASGTWSFHPAHLGWVNLVIAIVFGVFGILSQLIVGMREEIVFRGYLFQNLGERLPLWLAAALLCVIFVLVHGPGSFLILPWTIETLMLSAIWICTRLITKSLWLGIGIHGGHNASAYLVYILLLGAIPDAATTQATLATLEIPFIAVLLVGALFWSVRRAHVNWHVRLTDDSQPSVPTTSQASVIPATEAVFDPPS